MVRDIDEIAKAWACSGVLPSSKEYRHYKSDIDSLFYAYWSHKYGKGNKMKDNINHPQHYKSHPSGIECIEVAEHFNFNIGNAIKYLWRHDHKNSSLEDLKKAQWYITREINKRESEIHDKD